MLRVEMLSTGDEVLYGQIVDTNAAWLADYLFEHGLLMTRRSTVGDNFDQLVAILRERSQQADIIIVNGGLGPTSDDLSAAAAARAADDTLVEHPEWIKRMEDYFSSRGRVMSPTNRKQAAIPATSELVDNPAGTACGFMLRLNGCRLFFTPGVPSEFKEMVSAEIMPRLAREGLIDDANLCLRMTTFGRSESELAQQLDVLTLPAGVTLGYRSSMPIIELKLTGPARLQPQMEALWQEVRRVAGESALYEGTQPLAERLLTKVNGRGWRLAVSEQFSAGLLTAAFGGAGDTLVYGETIAAFPETGEQLLARTKTLCATHGVELALGVGAIDQNGQIQFALAWPGGGAVQRIAFGFQRHRPTVQRETAALQAQNLLRCWLFGLRLDVSRGWVTLEDFYLQPDP